MLQTALTTRETAQQPVSLKEQLQSSLPFSVDSVLSSNTLILDGDKLNRWQTVLFTFWQCLQIEEDQDGTILIARENKEG